MTLDAKGKVLWAVRAPTSATYKTSGLLGAHDKQILVAFDTYSSAELTVYDASGAIVAQQNIPGWDLSVPLALQDDGYLAAGHCTSALGASALLCIMHLGPDLTPVWAGGYGDDFSMAVTTQTLTTSANGAIFVGGVVVDTEQQLLLRVN